MVEEYKKLVLCSTFSNPKSRSVIRTLIGQHLTEYLLHTLTLHQTRDHLDCFQMAGQASPSFFV